MNEDTVRIAKLQDLKQLQNLQIDMEHTIEDEPYPDKLGKLGLTIDGCKERDRFVLQTCNDLNIPIMCSMGGGYSPELKTIIEAHANTFRLAQDIFFS